jgi:hypothetical protein
MSRNTVNQAWQLYKAGGFKAVHVQKTGRPPGLGRINNTARSGALVTID